ncbi:MAG: efflux RND transporter periplasmic adaptor subunit [Bacteroidales bacterium]|jgi:Cu(I)/Ag(I) efflux system membrane fusion protein|nr:efflux RND transporter periplasmic adaptor subunit [Bacteroidales bacterium]
MKSIKKTIAILIAILLVGGLIGYLVGNHQSSNPATEQISKSANQQIESSANQQIWTCSMHPQIRQNEPGDCPICGMDLIPLEAEHDDDIDPMAISMSPTAMQLASISTAVVGSTNPVKSIRLNGKVQADERLIFSQSSHIPGRIEALMLNFTGKYVTKGQVIASIYSPELVTAQNELFEAQKFKETQPVLFNSAKEKLKNWKLTDGQIENMLKSGSPTENFEVKADVSGYVTQKMVNPGDYIAKGETIYEIADLSKVWILFDVYESDMGWIKKGDDVEFTVASLPGESFSGTISFLDPVIDPKTRVAKARVTTANPGLKLKPEMFVSGTVQAQLPKKSEAIVVPKTAVMWTGKRSVVYVKSTTEQGVNFKMREITLGPALGESYVINDGLQTGEEIAVHGTFSIDAAAQLAGKPSMMSPDGGPAMTGHDHGEMDMSESADGTSKGETYVQTEVEPAFTAQLTKVYKAYLVMKEAFVESNPEKAANEAKAVSTALKSVDMSLLKGDAHNIWMEQLETLNSAIASIISLKDIEKQREAFSRFNQVFYKSLKSFGLDGQTAYHQYCPMAFGDKGAYWLSDIKEIRNPYFGDAMLKCGETRETLE